MPSLTTKELQETDLQLQEILNKIGQKGLLVHEVRLTDAISQLRKNLLSVNNFVHQSTGIENANSVAQVKSYIEKAGYPVRSVAQEILREFEGVIPHVSEITKSRKYSNLMSKLMAFEKAIDMDGRIRFKFRIDHGTTGRLYATEYNLQQLPAVGRHCILPDKGLFTVIDFKQFDLRVLAADSGEPVLVEAFQNGLDPYVVTAQKLFDTKDVTPEQRNLSKIVNLAICYGADRRTLIRSLGVTSEVAAKILENYYTAHPILRKWSTRIQDDARGSGIAVNRFGRKMMLDMSDSGKAVRQAVAMRGQGGAADILRSRLVALSEAGHSFSMTVHDSVIVDTEDEYSVPTTVDAIGSILTEPIEVLEGPFAGTTVPLDVTVKQGSSWGLAGHREELLDDYYAIRFDL